MSEHLLEMAKARVSIKDGKIEVLSDPGVIFCPLRRSLYGIEEESRESVERILQIHMNEMLPDDVIKDPEVRRVYMGIEA